MVDAIDVIYKRRSIRNYAGTPVERDTIETLLRAAMAAPTAINPSVRTVSARNVAITMGTR